MPQHLTLDVDNGVATLTLRRADNDRNQLNLELMGQLEVALEEAATLKLHALVVASGYEKLFSIGADIEAIGEVGAQQAQQFSKHGKEIFARFEQLPCVTIAAVHGSALGGGLELALACDLRICTAAARLGLPEINLGIIPGWGGTQRLARTVGRSRAMRMIFSGEPVNAQTALAWGLVDEVVETPVELLAAAHKLAARFAGKPRHALMLAKRAMYGAPDVGDAPQVVEQEGYDRESNLFTIAWEGAERVEGVAALREKRRPAWPD